MAGAFPLPEAGGCKTIMVSLFQIAGGKCADVQCCSQWPAYLVVHVGGPTNRIAHTRTPVLRGDNGIGWVGRRERFVHVGV
jgi:hypothetical protein